MSNNIMRLQLFKKSRPYWWLLPLPAVLCLYFMFQLSFSDAPFFVRELAEGVDPNMIPDARYRSTSRLWGLLGFSALFLALTAAMMRQWARYFLNRKIVISYLFFAVIPLGTTILIFFAIARSWYGIQSTVIFDKLLEMNQSEFQNFTEGLHIGIRQDALGSDLQTRIQRMVAEAKDEELSRFTLSEERQVAVTIYLQTPKVPGEDRYLFLMYNNSDDEMPGLVGENDREYEQLLPLWLEDDLWAGVIEVADRPALRHINIQTHEDDFRVVIIVTEKLDTSFLNRYSGIQAGRLALLNESGNITATSNDEDARWYFKLLFMPLGTTWDVMAMNWESGFYQPAGGIRFDLPGDIRSLVTESSPVPFFFADQKTSLLSFILGIIMIVIVCELVAFVFGGYLVSYITRSLNILAEGHERLSEGELGYQVPPIGKDQLGNMGLSFNAMVRNIQQLMTESAQNQKQLEELRIARDIQMSLLPDLDNLDWCNNIAADCIPARDVGGDYYEVVQAPGGEVGVFIADVSGKGTSAAFYMAELKGVLIALRHVWADPRELMLNLNEILKPALKKNVFISATYLLLCPVSRKGTLVRAGHCPSYRVHADGKVEELMPPGIAIGIADNKVFGKILDPLTFEMDRDDKIVLYTDGLDEMTHQDELYGHERLLRVLEEHAGDTVGKMRDAILNDVLNFSSGEQNDDLTLVVTGLPEPSFGREMVAGLEQNLN